jgi:polyhydroxyalkanoate synthesis regulator phasin
MAATVLLELQKLLRSAHIEAGEVDDALTSYLAELITMVAEGDMEENEASQVLSDVLEGYYPEFTDAADKAGLVHGLISRLLCANALVQQPVHPQQQQEQAAAAKAPVSNIDAELLPLPAPPARSYKLTTAEVDAPAAVAVDDDAEVNFLCSMLPHLSKPLVRFVLHQRCTGSSSAAAAQLLDEELVAQHTAAHSAWLEKLRKQEQSEKLSEEAVKERVLNKYSDQVVVPKGQAVNTNAPLRALTAVKSDKGPKVRYRDGHVATTNGAKMIITMVKPEWDGGSRGKVTTKGKRGKGFV